MKKVVLCLLLTVGASFALDFVRSSTDGTIFVDPSIGVYIAGAGIDTVRLNPNDTISGNVYIKASKLVFDANGANFTNCLTVYGLSAAWINNVTVRNAKISNGLSGSSGPYGLYCQYISNCIIEKCVLEGTQNGIYIVGGTYNVIRQNICLNTANNKGLNLQTTTNTIVKNNVFTSTMAITSTTFQSNFYLLNNPLLPNTKPVSIDTIGEHVLIAFASNADINWADALDFANRSSINENTLLTGKMTTINTSGAPVHDFVVDYGPCIPPTADAGIDLAAHINSTVNISGTNSTDPSNAYPLTYTWQLIAPQGSNAALVNNGSDVNLTPDVAGNYLVILIVKNTFGISSNPDTVIISTINSAPIANAGEDQYSTGSAVELNGAGSYDPDGDALTYSWEFISKPKGSQATLSSPTSEECSFIPDVFGVYEIRLTVTDPSGLSSSDIVLVSSENVAPVAGITPDAQYSGLIMQTYYLDGSPSYDVNPGDVLNYTWAITSKPVNSSAQIQNATTANASIVADVAGQYDISLTVTDKEGLQNTTALSFIAVATRDIFFTQMQTVINSINDLPLTSFKNKQMQKTFNNQCNAVINSVNSGDLLSAYSLLADAISNKTNGCATVGAPDKNDWIINCEGQGIVYPEVMNAVTILNQLK